MPRKSHKEIETEWSYLISEQDVPSEGRVFTISPNEVERKALAKRAGIVRLNSLQAVLRVDRERGAHMFIVSGEFKANITQHSIISMEPIESVVDEVFTAYYADHDEAVPFGRARHDAYAKSGVTEFPMLEEQEDPEPMVNGKIDLGELVAQYLCLAIDPYPYREGEGYENTDSIAVGAEALARPAEKLRPNPFEALKKWRPQD